MAVLRSRVVSLFDILLVAGVAAAMQGCYMHVPAADRPSVVKSPLPKTPLQQLPVNFDWSNVNGVMYVSPVTNQFVPSPCGSCWAHASVGALTDRIIIATKALKPVVRLSSQVLLNAGAVKGFGSCDGGSDVLAYQFIHENGITDETCMPYKGVDYSTWGELPLEDTMCWQCNRNGTCGFVSASKTYVSEYGSLQGEADMMNEIYNRGPIACSLFAHSPAFEQYKSGIITDSTPYNTTTHVVSITGWGVDQATGMKFWIGRNSFGTTWGEDGWFKLQRGTNCLDIEVHPCAWAVPLVK